MKKLKRLICRLRDHKLIGPPTVDMGFEKWYNLVFCTRCEARRDRGELLPYQYLIEKKMKLFIDDIRPAPDGWTQARDVTSAIRFLHKFGEQVEEISLDHDISWAVEVAGTIRPFPSPETFMAVAYYICARELKVDIIIHTANPVGGEYMRLLFMENGYIPRIAPASRVNRLESEV